MFSVFFLYCAFYPHFYEILCFSSINLLSIFFTSLNIPSFFSGHRLDRPDIGNIKMGVVSEMGLCCGLELPSTQPMDNVCTGKNMLYIRENSLLSEFFK